MSLINETPQWQALESHWQTLSATTLRELFANDPQRFARMQREAAQIFIDYSKNWITDETLKLLLDLAQVANVKNAIQRMFAGAPINVTEKRAALHVALRNSSQRQFLVDGHDVMPQVRTELTRMEIFVDKIRSGTWHGYDGRRITDVVNFGIGGSNLGPLMVTRALGKYHDGPRLHFVSNVDGTHIAEILKNLIPATTLFIISSKTFTTQETLSNATVAYQLLMAACKNDHSAMRQHFVAITSAPQEAINFNIDPNNIFEFWDWVGGRYSLWSAVGLPIAIAVGMPRFKELLKGAAAMDQHFATAELANNLPVIMALIGIWYVNFAKLPTQAILPYDQYLRYFPAYLQQLDMESNGKGITVDGARVNYATGPVVWGAAGTDGQHAFYQLIHQGTQTIPCDFIAPIHSHNPFSNHHLKLLANFLAQTEALMLGKTLAEAEVELLAQGLQLDAARKLASHKTFPGNRPTNTLLVKKFTPTTIGALLALYEHKVFVQGTIWNVNSFDQWGVELGKQLAKVIFNELLSATPQIGHDSSTTGLIKKIIKNRE